MVLLGLSRFAPPLFIACVSASLGFAARQPSLSSRPRLVSLRFVFSSSRFGSIKAGDIASPATLASARSGLRSLQVQQSVGWNLMGLVVGDSERLVLVCFLFVLRFRRLGDRSEKSHRRAP